MAQNGEYKDTLLAEQLKQGPSHSGQGRTDGLAQRLRARDAPSRQSKRSGLYDRLAPFTTSEGADALPAGDERIGESLRQTQYAKPRTKDENMSYRCMPRMRKCPRRYARAARNVNEDHADRRRTRRRAPGTARCMPREFSGPRGVRVARSTEEDGSGQRPRVRRQALRPRAARTMDGDVCAQLAGGGARDEEHRERALYATHAGMPGNEWVTVRAPLAVRAKALQTGGGACENELRGPALYIAPEKMPANPGVTVHAVGGGGGGVEKMKHEFLRIRGSLCTHGWQCGRRQSIPAAAPEKKQALGPRAEYCARTRKYPNSAGNCALAVWSADKGFPDRRWRPRILVRCAQAARTAFRARRIRSGLCARANGDVQDLIMTAATIHSILTASARGAGGSQYDTTCNDVSKAETSCPFTPSPLVLACVYERNHRRSARCGFPPRGTYAASHFLRQMRKPIPRYEKLLCFRKEDTRIGDHWNHEVEFENDGTRCRCRRGEEIMATGPRGSSELWQDEWRELEKGKGHRAGQAGTGGRCPYGRSYHARNHLTPTQPTLPAPIIPAAAPQPVATTHSGRNSYCTCDESAEVNDPEDPHIRCKVEGCETKWTGGHATRAFIRGRLVKGNDGVEGNNWIQQVCIELRKNQDGEKCRGTSLEGPNEFTPLLNAHWARLTQVLASYAFDAPWRKARIFMGNNVAGNRITAESGHRRPY
ncbi:hypothetical protein DFH09DRAFT_1108274 [Mycena vulgaris]|nr:hypothetical protein DFH09DRAFT_1108274 [Mycena vulgaris]